MKVKINRIPLIVLGEVMQKIIDTPAHEMVWYRGRIISPTKPSAFLTW